MRKLLAFIAIGEAFTGMALILVPALVGQLLFGTEPSGVGTVFARVAGIALFSLGVACWPGSAQIGMLTYSVLVTVILAYVGVSGGPAGSLLWPAVILHLMLTAVLAWASIVRK